MKKRILFIVHLPPPVHGTTKVCQSIMESRQINEAFDCYYLNCSGSLSMDDVNRLSIRKLMRLFKASVSIVKQLVFRRYDLVYMTMDVSGFAFLKDSLHIVIAKLFQRKVVVHLHGRGFREFRSRNRVLNGYCRLVFSGLRVIHLSSCLLHEIVDLVQPDKLFVVGNGVEGGDEPDYEARSKHAVPSVLYLSNLIESKGYFDLLTACVYLKKSDVACKVAFVGACQTADAADKVTAFIEQHELQNMVRFMGPKYAEEKEILLRNADLFVFPTYYERECFPLCILEAMANGLPVISTDIGAIVDIVEDGINGRIVSARDPRQLAKTIQKLVEDPKLRLEMGRVGREKYLKEYTLEAFENKLIEVLSKILMNP